MSHPDIAEKLRNLFDWNPPWSYRHEYAKKLCPPLLIPSEVFYDKHVDERLTLRRIVRLPSLIRDLTENAQNGLQNILLTDSGKASDLIAETVRRRRLFRKAQKRMIDANTVANFYRDTTAHACLGPASMILNLPQLSIGHTCLAWMPLDHRALPPYLSLRDDFTLSVFCVPDTRALLTDDQDTLQGELCGRLPYLGTWQILPMWQQSEDLIESMCDFEGERAFDHQQAGTRGLYNPPLRDVPPDALVPKCSLPPGRAHTTSETPRPSQLDKCAVLQSNGSSITVFPVKTDQISRTDAFIQRAWCKAVQNDCTFIVFTCGSLELIGIRHRATQTLYLSDPIVVEDSEDVLEDCQDPGYGLLHLGLYIAIFEDAKDRVQQMKAAEQMVKVEPEESTDAILGPLPTPGICNSGTQLARQKKEVTLHEASRRSLLLLQFRYSQYNSRSPSAFKRTASSLVPGLESIVATDFSRCRYDPEEYVSIVVSSYIGAGTTGTAHRATLEMLLPDGSVYSYSDAVLKFADAAYQRRKLLKEYAIYKHLAQAKVTGIPIILGLFEGVEEGSSGPLLMIMNYCGTSLLYRDTTDSERQCFEKTLNAIHNAGVIHDDIRPNNLLVNEAGQTTIIDFDCARVVTSVKYEKLKEEEVERLRSVFTKSEFGWSGLSASSRAPSPSNHWYSDED